MWYNLFSHPHIPSFNVDFVVVLPKSASPERMKENADVDFEISGSDMKALDGMNANEHVTWDPTNVV